MSLQTDQESRLNDLCGRLMPLSEQGRYEELLLTRFVMEEDIDILFWLTVYSPHGSYEQARQDRKKNVLEMNWFLDEAKRRINQKPIELRNACKSIELN